MKKNGYLTDYQGNIRAVYNQSWNSIVQQTDYYPYGLPKATSSRAEANPYKYGGKELNTDLQQPFYDFSARLQLPQLGLFQRHDPKAGDYSGLNPYTYCGADPINYVDPDGKFFYPLIAAAVGATIDAMTQISVNLISGQTFGDALCNVDLTSILASGVTSALLGPGAGMGAKIAAGGVNVADAAVDIKLNGDIGYVGGEGENGKPIEHAAIDLGTSLIPDFGINHKSMDFSTPEIPSNPDGLTSLLEVGSRNWTNKELDNATKIVFKLNGEGIKYAKNIWIKKIRQKQTPLNRLKLCNLHGC